MKIISLTEDKNTKLLIKIKPQKIINNTWKQDELIFDEDNSSNKSIFGDHIGKGLPEPKAWTKQLVTGIAEVLIGERPIFQLMRWVSFEVYLEIDKNMKLRDNTSKQRVRPLIRSVHIDQTSENVIQAIAVIQKGNRGRGMGIRLEAEIDRWRCTELLVA